LLAVTQSGWSWRAVGREASGGGGDRAWPEHRPV